MEFTIYTRPLCGWCDRAKKLMQAKGWDYEEIDVATLSESDQDSFRAQYRTFPQIMTASGEYIGGYDAFSAWVKSQATE